MACRDEHVFITGIIGFVGSFLTEFLVSLDFNIVSWSVIPLASTKKR